MISEALKLWRSVKAMDDEVQETAALVEHRGVDVQFMGMDWEDAKRRATWSEGHWTGFSVCFLVHVAGLVGGGLASDLGMIAPVFGALVGALIFVPASILLWWPWREAFLNECAVSIIYEDTRDVATQWLLENGGGDATYDDAAAVVQHIRREDLIRMSLGQRRDERYVVWDTQRRGYLMNVPEDVVTTDIPDAGLFNLVQAEALKGVDEFVVMRVS